jgi:hypothetical protein
MEGIILDEYTDKKQCKLLVINPDGSRELYEPSASGFVKVQDIPAPATADHKHSNISVKFETGEGVMIFENGILVKVDN